MQKSVGLIMKMASTVTAIASKDAAYRNRAGAGVSHADRWQRGGPAAGGGGAREGGSQKDVGPYLRQGEHRHRKYGCTLTVADSK